VATTGWQRGRDPKVYGTVYSPGRERRKGERGGSFPEYQHTLDGGARLAAIDVITGVVTSWNPD
jgi:hypothetical protein